ncbi:hypothetical protein [Brevundimonas sp. EYE_349]|uniref:hypothetical protein n=1 Tax=Brevundimonas sp. EYE_349 TaxID=2853455 RepID=UPI002002A052|nr:hypothetical protein [Brevundimonas sp. EYE_349]MCK6104244.1 hypothetical protein [Brevundimonas sp. EYE_349]
MANRKRGAVGLGTAIGGLILLAAFNENIASILEDTQLNRAWTLVEPSLRWLSGLLVAMVGYLVHPVATHLYAFVVGGVVTIGAVRFAVSRQNLPSRRAEMISLPDLVEYLTMETEWAQSRRAVTDRDLQFELLDILTTGKLNAYARQQLFGHPGPLRRISPGYFEAAIINTHAIRNGAPQQITLKPTYSGDHFEHWQFQQREVESIWPRPKTPKEGWPTRFLGR